MTKNKASAKAVNGLVTIKAKAAEGPVFTSLYGASEDILAGYAV